MYEVISTVVKESLVPSSKAPLTTVKNGSILRSFSSFASRSGRAMTERKVNKSVKRDSSREDEPMVRVQRQRRSLSQ